MDYKNHYDKLIDRARGRLLECYTERHHIIPVCMGGSDEPENLVDLTAEEHYVAHQLLVKIYPDNQSLIYAANMMTVSGEIHVRNNKRYAWLRKKYQKVCKRRVGEKNGSYGTRWIYSVELRTSKKIRKDESLPIGWQEGRVVDFDRYFEKQHELSIKKSASERKKKELNEAWMRDLKAMLIYYRDNDVSLRELADIFNTHRNVYKSFERYFPDEYREIVKNKPNNSYLTKGRY